MKQDYKIWLIAFLGIFLGACSDDKIDSSVISSGVEMSKEAREAEQNLDKASYAELADLFLDTKDIVFDRDVLLILGKNNCPYCDILKSNIKDSEELKTSIKEHFNPYYINTSYSKTHDIDWTDRKSSISTFILSSIFGVNFTPTIVFLNKDGSVKYIYPGYTPEIKTLISQVINQQGAMGDYSAIDSKLRAL